MFKGKKVSRNYQRCIDEFAEKHFGIGQDFYKLPSLNDQARH